MSKLRLVLHGRVNRFVIPITMRHCRRLDVVLDGKLIYSFEDGK